MDAFDIVLLGALCCLIGAGFLFRQRVVRLVVVFILFCISFGSVMLLTTLGPRSVVSQHEQRGGQSSKDFVEGVSSTTKLAGLYYPYIALATVGLALMAVLGQRKERDHE